MSLKVYKLERLKVTCKLVNLQTFKHRNMETISRYLMFAGIVLFLLGAGTYLAAKFGIPLGRLPGDIRIEGEHGGFYFPVTSSILISGILMIVVNVIVRLLRK